MFLPAYSPDLSPIELCWSKFKEFLGSRQALSSGTIRSSYQRSVGGASAAATSLKLLKMMPWGMFEHCGLFISKAL
ncbi:MULTISPECIES: transposase [Okeania]|uniref:Tc1-like transposase DDE domain-containing protein n=1 Tax=Okeania hirsuta TaxID=1458930 RepID=A0A3N6QRB1_9CYAN|nr:MULTISPECIES: transposase [Okeania]NET12704.1 hypothetical protein [Okeania sp. SIO1H6]NES77348.1 hypothetical protein [Okeania sp. SIO1H4]NES88361.1 hypothetical protein [Okeania sp. SIO2B9]NET22364.1 hypothetical protein [Okeania sp. SIO1H5]NET77552.1 hypothetical protein [Okeania sp. SIO1F9]